MRFKKKRANILFILLAFLSGELRSQHWPVLGPTQTYVVTPEICLDTDGGIISLDTYFSNQFALRKYGLGGDLLWTRTIRCQTWMIAGLNIIKTSTGYLVVGLIAENANQGSDPWLIKLNDCLEFEWSLRLDAGAHGAVAIDAWELSDSLILVHTPYVNSNYQSFLFLNPFTQKYKSAYTLRAWEGVRFPLDSGASVFMGTAQVDINKDGWFYDKLEVYPIDSQACLQTKRIYYGDRNFPACFYADMELHDSGYMILVKASSIDSVTQQSQHWSELILVDNQFEVLRFHKLTDKMQSGGVSHKPFFLAPIDTNRMISISVQYGSANPLLWLNLLKMDGEVLKDTIISFSLLGYEPDPDGFDDLFITSHSPLSDGSILLGGAMRVGGGAYQSFLLKLNKDLAFDKGLLDTVTYGQNCTDTLRTGLLDIPEPVAILLNLDSFELTPIDSQVMIDPLSIRLLEQNGMHGKLYPNPASNLLYIDLPDGLFILTLYTADGRQINSWQTEGGIRGTVPVLGLVPGIYHLNVISETGEATIKFTFILVGS